MPPIIITDKPKKRSSGLEGVLFEKDNKTFKPTFKGPKQTAFWVAVAPFRLVVETIRLPFRIVGEAWYAFNTGVPRLMTGKKYKSSRNLPREIAYADRGGIKAQ